MKKDLTGYSSFEVEKIQHNRLLRRKINSVVFGISFLSAAIIYPLVNNSSEEQYVEAKQNLEEAQKSIENLRDDKEETETNILRVKKELGEACTSKLVAFMPDGELEGTEEDSIVFDLVNEPNSPCGDTQIEARKNVRRLSLEYDESQKINADITENENKLPELATNLERESDNQNDAELGALGGGGLSIIVWGAMSYGLVYSDLRKKY